MKSRTLSVRSERGFALVIAIFATVLMALIGITLTNMSMTEFANGNEFEAHEQALLIADSGLQIVRSGLTGADLDAVLAAQSEIPQYIDFTEPEEGTYAARNPMVPLELRHIDFRSPPQDQASRTTRGQLTPAGGVGMGQGRYFASLSDNDDEADLGLSNDPYDDQDDTVYVRVMGAYPTGNSQNSSVGGQIKNAIAVLEALLKKEDAFGVSAPVTIYGPDITAVFSGNSWDIDADSSHHAIAVAWDDEVNGDAATTYASMLTAVAGSETQMIGLDGPDGVPINDITAELRSSGDALLQISDPHFLSDFVNNIAAYADILYTEDTTLSGENIVLGTAAAPKITVALGNLDLSGNMDGAGMLVVRGSLSMGGALEYDGIIMVTGWGHTYVLHGLNKGIDGAILMATYGLDTNGDLVYGPPYL